MIPVLRACAAAVLAAAVLAAGGCSPPLRCPPGASCPSLPPPRVTFIPAVNGKTGVLRKDGHVPSYRVRPGEYLMMAVTVTVPKTLRITALWFGISTGTWGNAPKGRPVGLNPILAHYHQPLSAGSHTFWLRWRIPKHRSGASLYLVTSWTSRRWIVARAVAELALN